ncbi:MAG: serine/threonine-protein kinase [Thermoanaerobaculia bacterium]|nr:serine/threonine-protein kinase [Thermoanaerobaculia bacterium]
MESERQQFRELEGLFHNLLNETPERQAETLARLRESRPVLADQLAALLERDRDGSAFPSMAGPLHHLLVDDRTLGIEPGETVGPYQILRELGAGGMGIVYEAEQQAPLQRRVALKIMRWGFQGPRALSRFDSERDSLARLDHPAIATIFDAGTRGDHPFLVMELVEGVPILRYCDAQSLPIRDRIGLFLQVCGAVQHAHQKGVLHRDLKPANLLVTEYEGRPHVKVIDFGIAKLLDEIGTRSDLTAVGEVVGTPDYMSPEQMRGGSRSIDTRADVYSLGVVLYELLTGQLPIPREAIQGAGPAETWRLVAETVPIRPEHRLSPITTEIAAIAKQRGCDPSRLRRELRGDLSHIVLKALRKEPERRFSSVEQISDDLRRYLEGRPVLARPDSLTYRVSKLARRHAQWVAAGALLFLGLLSATGVSTIMFLRADKANRESEEQRATAVTLNNFLTSVLTSVDPAYARGRDLSILRQVLDDAASRIDVELIDLPGAAAEMHLAVGQAYRSIGELDSAEEHLRQSLAGAESVEPLTSGLVATASLALGALLRDRDQHGEAERLLREALRLRTESPTADQTGVAEAMTEIARLCDEIGCYDEADTLYQRALQIYDGDVESSGLDRIATLRSYGTYLMNQNRMAEAEAPLRDTVVGLRRLVGADHPSLITPLIVLGRWLRSSKLYDEAERYLLEAQSIAERHLAAEHPLRLELTTNLANLYQQMGSLERSETLYREALAGQIGVHGEAHSSVGTTLNNLGSLLHSEGRDAEAAEFFSRAVAIYRSTLGERHYWVSIALFNQGRSMLGFNGTPASEDLVREAIEIRRELGAAPWQIAECELLLATHWARRGACTDALPMLEAGIKVMEEQFGSDTDRTAAAAQAMIECLEPMRVGE